MLIAGGYAPGRLGRVNDHAMTRGERTAFVAALHVGVLGVECPDGSPLLTPVWYRVNDDAIEFNTERTSAKADLLAAAGRATLLVQREEPPYAYVAVDGPIEIVETSYEARIDLAVRYLGERAGNAFVGATLDVDDVMVRLTPTRWRTTDYAKVDE
jgi:uncharacterized protein